MADTQNAEEKLRADVKRYLELGLDGVFKACGLKKDANTERLYNAIAEASVLAAKDFAGNIHAIPKTANDVGIYVVLRHKDTTYEFDTSIPAKEIRTRGQGYDVLVKSLPQAILNAVDKVTGGR